jgi:hypothetical protein
LKNLDEAKKLTRPLNLVKETFMRNTKLTALTLILILLGSIGCKEAIRQAYPSPVAIEMKAEDHFFADPDVLITIRNKGASGKILVIITQGGKSWKRIFYFDHEEQRQVKITCPGLESGKYDYVGQAAELSSPEELRDAYGG